MYLHQILYIFMYNMCFVFNFILLDFCLKTRFNFVFCF